MAVRTGNVYIFGKSLVFDNGELHTSVARCMIATNNGQPKIAIQVPKTIFSSWSLSKSPIGTFFELAVADNYFAVGISTMMTIIH